MSKTFKSFSELDVMMHNQKIAAGKYGAVPLPTSEPVEYESELHDQIIAYCKNRRWHYVHSRMDQRTTTALGCVDFVIAADGGRTYWIEAKGAKTKVTREQAGVLHWLESLGHRAAYVRSFSDFLDVINLDKENPQNKPS